MSNQEAVTLLQNSHLLNSLMGFDLAKAITINLKKIDDEVVAVIRNQVKEHPEQEETIMNEALAKECDIKFLPVKEEWYPRDITVQQYRLLEYWKA